MRFSRFTTKRSQSGKSESHRQGSGYGGRSPHRGGHASNRSANPSTGRRYSSHSGSSYSSRGRSFRRNAPVTKHVPHAKYINKAAPIEEAKPYEPTHKFSDFPFIEALKKNIEHKGYEHPTPIQDQSIPPIIAGKDVVGIANTGTGKTAAFLLPLIDKVIKNRPTTHEKVLILVPTRELAQQIHDEFLGFARGLNLYSAVCVGGISVGSQISALRRSPNFVIATPGRLKDLIERKLLRLERCKTVVLDEADRMLDMGFINDIRFLLSHMPENRHSLFFSATIPPEVRDLIKQFLKDPITISVTSRDTSANVDQDVVRVPNKGKKFEILEEILRTEGMHKVLIFGRTKFGVEKLSVALEKKGFKAASIHGNKSQSQRQRALNLFKSNAIDILVATDVAARGLDIPAVSHVINYDVPATYEDYIHRIGRTGRAGKQGKALTFVD